MYDVLRASYRFHCPGARTGGFAPVPLSRFRRIERLPRRRASGRLPRAYRCECGDDHVGLVSHDDLDYRPIGASEVEFTNLLTGQPEPAGMELARARPRCRCSAATGRGGCICCREAKLKPVFPSCLSHVAPGESELVGVAMTCPSCGQLSLNVVTQRHLDVPFYHDEIVRVIERPFGDVRDLTVDRFHHESCGRPGSTPSATDSDVPVPGVELGIYTFGELRQRPGCRRPRAWPRCWRRPSSPIGSGSTCSASASIIGPTTSSRRPPSCSAAVARARRASG